MATAMTRTLATLKSARDLIDAGLVSAQRESGIAAVGQKYAIAVTPHIAQLIDVTAVSDAIARQFIPDPRELRVHESENADPIGDDAMSPVTGIVHRYADRVLVKIASVCPVYCRFCFRREMVGPELGETLSARDLKHALDYIAATPEIWEVILTGGDPFVLSPRRVREVTMALGNIPHVKILRWHTRVPVVDPGRITDDLVAALTSSDKTVFVGLHVNHARELNAAALTAISQLVDAGIPLVSQTVLLKGVNDSADALEALLRGLTAARVTPYYLHHGDLAPGTSHFRTTIERGLSIMDELRRRLSGLAMPEYVLDIPGAHGKVALTSAAVTHVGNGLYEIRDRFGTMHRYRDCV
jgi:lysine 2,3-aminomutase